MLIATVLQGVRIAVATHQRPSVVDLFIPIKKQPSKQNTHTKHGSTQKYFNSELQTYFK